MQALFRELIPQIEDVALAGKPEYVRAYWVTGLKRLPIRYRISAHLDNERAGNG